MSSLQRQIIIKIIYLLDLIQQREELNSLSYNKYQFSLNFGELSFQKTCQPTSLPLQKAHNIIGRLIQEQIRNHYYHRITSINKSCQYLIFYHLLQNQQAPIKESQIQILDKDEDTIKKPQIIINIQIKQALNDQIKDESQKIAFLVKSEDLNQFEIPQKCFSGVDQKVKQIQCKNGEELESKYQVELIRSSLESTLSDGVINYLLNKYLNKEVHLTLNHQQQAIFNKFILHPPEYTIVLQNQQFPFCLDTFREKNFISQELKIKQRNQNNNTCEICITYTRYNDYISGYNYFTSRRFQILKNKKSDKTNIVLDILEQIQKNFVKSEYSQDISAIIRQLPENQFEKQDKNLEEKINRNPIPLVIETISSYQQKLIDKIKLMSAIIDAKKNIKNYFRINKQKFSIKDLLGKFEKMNQEICNRKEKNLQIDYLKLRDFFLMFQDSLIDNYLNKILKDSKIDLKEQQIINSQPL